MPKKLASTGDPSKLNSVLEKFRKTMGDGVIHMASIVPPCRKVRSSIPAYNYVTSGGFPIGRVIEHYGANGSLKSYTAYDAIAQFQHYDWANHEQSAFRSFEYDAEGNIINYTLRKGYSPTETPIARRVVLVDTEKSYTPDWGKKFGIDNDGLLVINSVPLTQAVDMVQALLAEEDVSLIVIDSLSAVGTDDEVESSMENAQMASGARFWNKAFRKFQAAMNLNPSQESTLLVINSAYQKTGIAYGDPEVIRNGEQLQRTKDVSVKFRALKEIGGKVDDVELNVGKNVVLSCKKNKCGVNGREVNFFFAFIDYDGVKAYKTDIATQIVTLALRFGLVTRKGAWYSYDDIKTSGLDNFKTELIDNGRLKVLEELINRKIDNSNEDEDA